MDDLLEFILSTFTEFLKEQGKLLEIKDKGVSFDSPRITDTSFIDTNISAIITKTMTMCHDAHFAMGHIKGNMQFCDSCHNDKDFGFFIKYACFLMYLFNKIRTFRKYIKLTLINFPGKKYVPSNAILTPLQVNSGVTILHSPGYVEVIVFRKEEMLKVLTHELIHAFELDASYIGPQEEKDLTHKFCLLRTIRMNESYTDAFACLLNVVMYTILEDTTGKNIRKRFARNLKKELDFIHGQAYKLLHVVKYDAHCSHTNRETTSAISYYVLKSVLLSVPEMFVRFLQGHHYVLSSVEDFKTFLTERLRDTNLALNGLNQYNKVNKHISTMRMSMLDIMNLRSHFKSI